MADGPWSQFKTQPAAPENDGPWAQFSGPQQQAQQPEQKPKLDLEWPSAAERRRMVERSWGIESNDTGMNVPEAPATLAAQVQAVQEGRKPAVMYPKGTPEPSVPDYLSRVETERGAFHFDPKQTDAEKITAASKAARENDVLGLGPHSKDDIQGRVAKGEPPLVVTERKPDGTEVKAAVGTTSTAPGQIAEISKNAAPGNKVGIETPEQVIAARQIDPNKEVAPLDDPGRARAMQKGTTESGIFGNNFLTAEEGYKERQAKIQSAQVALEEADQRYRGLAQRAERIRGMPMPKKGGGSYARRMGFENELADAAEALRLARAGLNAANASAPPTQSAWSNAANRFAQAIVTMPPDIVAGLARPFEAMGLDAGLAKKAAAASKAMTEGVNIDPARQEEISGKLAQGLGSSIGFMISGAFGRAAGLTAKASAAGAGAAQNAEQYYRQAEEAGQKGWAKFQAYMTGAAIGSSEGFIGLGGIADRVDKMTGGGVKRYLGMVLKESGEEGFQEAAQQLADNFAQWGLFNKGTDIMKDVAENALIGALTGGLMAGAIGGVGRLSGAGAAQGRIPQLPEGDIANPAMVETIVKEAIARQAQERQQQAPGQVPQAPPMVPPGVTASSAITPQVAPNPPQIVNEPTQGLSETQPPIQTEPAPPIPDVSRETSASVPADIPDTPETRILREIGYEDVEIAAMPPAMRRDAVAEAQDNGIVDPGPQARPASVQPTQPQTANNSNELPGAFGGVASGMVDSMYDGLWEKVQAGVTKEAGAESTLLQAAKIARENGGLKTIDDLKSFANDYAKIERGPSFQGDMRALIKRHSSQQSAGTRAKAPDLSQLSDDVVGNITSELMNARPNPDATTVRVLMNAEEISALRKAGLEINDNGTMSAATAEILLSERDKRRAASRAPRANTPADLFAGPATEGFKAGRSEFRQPDLSKPWLAANIIEANERLLRQIIIESGVAEDQIIFEAVTIAAERMAGDPALDPVIAYAEALVQVAEAESGVSNGKREQPAGDTAPEPANPDAGSTTTAEASQPDQTKPEREKLAADGAGGVGEAAAGTGKAGRGPRKARAVSENGAKPDGDAQTQPGAADRPAGSAEGQEDSSKGLTSEEEIGAIFDEEFEAGKSPAAEKELKFKVGDSWASPDGTKRVEKIEDRDGKPVYWVRTEGERSIVANSESDIDTAKRVDAENIISRARDQEVEDKKAKEESAKQDLDGFTDGMTPMAAGRAVSTLAAMVNYKGRHVSRRDLVREKVKNGAVIATVSGERVLQSPDETFLGAKQITKIGLDYAEHRFSQKTGSNPAPTAVQAAKSAVKNVAMGLDEVTKAAAALFGAKPGRIGSGLSFDEETYKQAVPIFKAGVAHFAAAAKDIKAMVRALLAHFRKEGIPDESIQNMRQYVIRFISEVESGKIDLQEATPTQEPEAPGYVPDAPLKTTRETIAKTTPAELFPAKVAQYFLDGRSFRTILEARKFARDEGQGDLDAKRVEEMIELGVVLAAREIVEEGKSAEATYDALVDLYGRQPRLGTRTGTSIQQQAYSTPAPLAYLAAHAAGIDETTTVYEPSAGNGMLLITASPNKSIVNELNKDRADALDSQGFAKVRREDASEYSPGLKVERVIANPPFGVVRLDDGTTRRFDMATIQPGYVTGEIDHAIALKALETMSPDGKAALILGGINKLAKSDESRSDGYNGKAKREFYKVLYDNYNVVDHYTAAGDLYERQGAGYPVDVIIIHGTGKSARSLPSVSVPKVYNSWADLKEKINVDGLQQPEGTDRGSAGDEAGKPAAGSDGRADAGDRTGVVERPDREPAALESDGIRDFGNFLPELPVAANGQRANAADISGERGEPGGTGARVDERKQRVNTEQETAGQVSYTPKSEKSDALGTLVPANMQTAITKALDNLAERVGPLEEFVADNLGMSMAELPEAFAAEQIDALALAIDNLNNGAGFIIGDQTGIGKGRVNAGIIRYALTKGMTPVFVTEKPNLYADMYRDLTDTKVQDFLGRDVNILMTNSSVTIPLDEDGAKVIKPVGSAKTHNAKLVEIAGNGGDIGEYDVVFTNYSQMQTVKGEATDRHTFLRSLAPNAILIFDESHNAGGGAANDFMPKKKDAAPNRAEFARELIRMAKGTFYSSATYAKRPEVMDLYSATDMMKAVASPDALAGAITKGGIPLQQAVASMLAEAGQYIRRERSFAGVTYDAPIVDVDVQAYESMSKAFLAVFKFSEHIGKAVKEMDKAIKADAKAASTSGATGTAGVSSINFSSIMHNLVGQMLLALKAPIAAQKAVAAIKEGKRPVITVANTLESFLREFADENDISPGDGVGLSFRDLVLRYLEKTRTITIKKPFMKKGEKGEKHYLTDEELGPVALAAYNAAKKIIQEAQLGSLPVSPIDFIEAQIVKAGYSVGEITGRQARLDYTTGETPIYRMRKAEDIKIKGRLATISKFNSGETDAIILNQAGATGLSLHASEKFADQRKRHMIIAQAEANIDTHMQMLGRVHRTGQVVAPSYEQLVAGIPAEKRPAAVLSKKMASLNASTTASRGGALTSENTPDFMNEYGDHVVWLLMQDNPDLHHGIGRPLGDFNEDKKDGAIQRVTGRIPLLPVAKQEQLYDLIESSYKDYLAEREAAGENALEAKRLDLDAVTVSSNIIAPSTGNSPFTSAVVAETVDMKRQGKPFKASEVVTAIEAGLKINASGETVVDNLRDLWVKGKSAAESKANAALSDFKVYRKDVTGDIEGETRLNSMNAKMDAIEEQFRRVSSIATPGGRVSLDTGDERMTGIVTSISNTGKTVNPLALGSWRMGLAVPGRGVVYFSFNRLDTIVDPDLPEGQVYQISTSTENLTKFAELFDESAKNTREKRVMLTGNILKAYDFANRKGQIVNFTTREGEVRQGIMLATTVKNVADLVKGKGTPIGDAAAVFAYVKDQGIAPGSDGIFLTYDNSWRKNLQVKVPAAKAKGGRFYLNPSVLEIAQRNGDFMRLGPQMVATIDNERDQQAIIKAMMDAGAVFEKPYELPGQKPAVYMPASRTSGLTENAVSAGIDRQHIEDVVRNIAWRVAGLPPSKISVVDVVGINAPPAAGAYGAMPFDGASGKYTIGTGAIEIALDAVDPLNSIHHEVFHALQNMGVFTQQELDVMEREGPRLREQLVPFYGKHARGWSQIETEAGAYGYYADARENGRPIPSFHIGVRRALERLYRFFRAVANYFRGFGFQTSEDIFDKAYRGELNPRTRIESGLFPIRDDAMGEDRFHPGWAEASRPRPRATPALGTPERGRMREAASEFSEYVADRMLRLKEAEETLAKAMGGRVEPAYRTETLSYGRMNERIETAWRDQVQPILAGLRTAGINNDEMHEYLYARHAQERNEHIAKINLGDARYADGGSGMETAEADAILAKIAADPREAQFRAIAAKVYDLIESDLSHREAAGLISQDAADEWRNQYHSYVPLQGFEGLEDNSREQMTGRAASVRGPESMAATGRLSRADDIFGNVINRRIEGIARAEKNRVANSVLRLARQMDLHYGKGKGLLTPILQAPKKRVLGSDGIVREVADQSYKNDPDVIVAKIGGHEVGVRVQDARLAKALKNLLMQEHDGVVQFIANLTRAYGHMRTIWNPAFALKNFVRDFQEALAAAFTIIGPKGPALFVKNLMGAGMKASAAWNFAGKEDADFKEFRLSGGKITYAKVRTLDQIKRRLDKERNGSRFGPSALGRHVIHGLETWNDFFETAVRYALYKSALDAGKSKAEAASLSLEGTLNFYRRGYGKIVEAAAVAHPFFNATLQSPLRAKRLALTKRGAVAYGALIPAGFLVGMMNYMVAGDDDDGTPFWDKAAQDYRYFRNFIIYTGGKDDKGKPNAITIPSFPEMMLPFLIGNSMAAAIFGKRGLGDLGGDAIKAIYHLTPIEGRGFTPALAAPVTGIATNTDWKGAPIHPSSDFGRRGVPKPEVKWGSTADMWQNIARLIGRASGGDDVKPGMVNLHPEDVRFLARELSGGFYAIADWGAQMMGMAPKDDRLPPVARDFYAEGGALHSTFERKEFQKQADQANAKKAAIERKIDVQSDNPQQRRARRFQSRETIEREGGVLGPRAGITTAKNEIMMTGRQEITSLRKKMDAAQKAGNMNAVRDFRSKVTETQKRYRKMAQDVEAGTIQFQNIRGDLARIRAQLRRQ